MITACPAFRDRDGITICHATSGFRWIKHWPWRYRWRMSAACKANGFVVRNEDQPEYFRPFDGGQVLDMKAGDTVEIDLYDSEIPN